MGDPFCGSAAEVLSQKEFPHGDWLLRRVSEVKAKASLGRDEGAGYSAW